MAMLYFVAQWTFQEASMQYNAITHPLYYVYFSRILLPCIHHTTQHKVTENTEQGSEAVEIMNQKHEVRARTGYCPGLPGPGPGPQAPRGP